MPSAVSVEVRVTGNEHNGFCDAWAIAASGDAPLAQTLQYDSGIEQLTRGFFLVAALAPCWSWGHGFYDRDYELILTHQALKTFVAGVSLPFDDECWPGPGVRIGRNDDGFRVVCLAGRAGRGLFDLSVQFKNGQFSTLVKKEVLTWGEGVLY